MCLIKGKENDTCIHPWCSRAKKLPKYHITRQSLIDGNPNFIEFKRWKSDYSNEYWMMAENKEPGRPMTEIKTFGEWPIDRKIFKRSEIEVQYVESVDIYPTSFNLGTMKSNYGERLNVDEFYVYIGSY